MFEFLLRNKNVIEGSNVDYNEYVNSLCEAIIDKQMALEAKNLLSIFNKDRFIIDGNNFSSRKITKIGFKYIDVYSDGVSINITFVNDQGRNVTSISQVLDEVGNIVLTYEQRNLSSYRKNNNVSVMPENSCENNQNTEVKRKVYNSQKQLISQETFKSNERVIYDEDTIKIYDSFSSFDNILEDRREYYLNDEDDTILLSDLKVRYLDPNNKITEYYGIYWGDRSRGIRYIELSKELFNKVLSQSISLDDVKKELKDAYIENTTSECISI